MPQPRDGDCLFHAVEAGRRSNDPSVQHEDAFKLRQEVIREVRQNPAVYIDEICIAHRDWPAVQAYEGRHGGADAAMTGAGIMDEELRQDVIDTYAAHMGQAGAWADQLEARAIYNRFPDVEYVQVLAAGSDGELVPVWSIGDPEGGGRGITLFFSETEKHYDLAVPLLELPLQDSARVAIGHAEEAPTATAPALGLYSACSGAEGVDVDAFPMDLNEELAGLMFCGPQSCPGLPDCFGADGLSDADDADGGFSESDDFDGRIIDPQTRLRVLQALPVKRYHPSISGNPGTGDPGGSLTRRDLPSSDTESL